LNRSKAGSIKRYTGQIQILFGVADASDTVCKIVRELIEKNPGRDAQLIVCAESPGATTAKFQPSFNSNGWSNIR